jgi:hypothetical protein
MHGLIRPTGNISANDAECELKIQAAQIQHIHWTALQRGVFRFHLQRAIASVCSFDEPTATHRDPITKRPSVMKLQGLLESNTGPEPDFGNTDNRD